MPAPLPTLLSPDPASTGAQAILDAARELFGERGVDAVSMQDVASAAGVCKANVFHHFANKERLYLEVMRSCFAAPESSVAAIIASPAPLLSRFKAFIEARINEMLASEAGMRLVMREVITANAERARLLAQQIFSGKIAADIAFFEDAQRRGELAANAEPAACSMLLGAACMFFFNCRSSVQHLGLPGSLDVTSPKSFAASVAPLLCGGIAAPAVAVRTPPSAVRSKAKGKAGLRSSSVRGRPAARSSRETRS